MSARNLCDLDYGELAAFLGTNQTAAALDSVLGVLGDRNGGKVRRLVDAMRATVAAVAAQTAYAAPPAAESDAPAKRKPGRPRKVAIAADAPKPVGKAPAFKIRDCDLIKPDLQAQLYARFL